MSTQSQPMNKLTTLEEIYHAASAWLIKIGKDKGQGIEHQPAAMGLQ
jgi:hypothetical protein